jgi:hypothetical protein
MLIVQQLLERGFGEQQFADLIRTASRCIDRRRRIDPN